MPPAQHGDISHSSKSQLDGTPTPSQDRLIHVTTAVLTLLPQRDSQCSSGAQQLDFER